MPAKPFPRCPFRPCLLRCLDYCQAALHELAQPTKLLNRGGVLTACLDTLSRHCLGASLASRAGAGVPRPRRFAGVCMRQWQPVMLVCRTAHQGPGLTWQVPKRAGSTPRYLLKLQTEVDAMQQLGPSLDAVYLKVCPSPSLPPPHVHPMRRVSLWPAHGALSNTPDTILFGSAGCQRVRMPSSAV